MSTNESELRVEEAALAHAKAREDLVERIKQTKFAQRQILMRRRRGLKSALEQYQATHEVLMAEVEENPQLFKKPRTKILHGLRIGFMKQKGKLIVANKGKTIKAIKSLFPSRADTLIRVSEEPVKQALSQLTATELKRIGVEVTADTDAVVVKSTDSDLDKLIAALADQEWEEEGL